MNVIGETKKLGLPADQCVVVAGSAMAVYGLKDTYDVDLSVTEAVYKRLKAEGWEEITHSDGSTVLCHDVYDLGTDWDNATTAELLQDSDIVDGVAVVSIERVLSWKRRMNREKDQNDIKIIEAYLAKQKP